MPDVLEEKRVWRGYPTEKPVNLIEKLITQSTQLGEVVCDPFFGSGSSIIAATNLGRAALGNDIANDAHEYLEKRQMSNAITIK